MESTEALSCLAGSIYHSLVKDEFLDLTRCTFNSHHSVYFNTSHAVLKWTFFKVGWKSGPPYFLTLLTSAYYNSSGPFDKMTTFTLRGKIEILGPFICQGNYKGYGRNLIFMYLTLSFGRGKKSAQWQFCFLFFFFFTCLPVCSLVNYEFNGEKVFPFFLLYIPIVHIKHHRNQKVF